MDFGESWQNAAGETVDVPVKTPDSNCLVHDYAAEGLKVYLKDIRLDPDNRPVILYLVSKGYESGPENGPRTWMTAQWTGSEWSVNPVTESDSNYDTGSLYLEPDGTWRIIAPTETGPQPCNPGGEMVMWVSNDQGVRWERTKKLTQNSDRNHTYARSPVNAHPDFYSLWADGNAREASKSCIYYSDQAGTVYQLPKSMSDGLAKPTRVS